MGNCLQKILGQTVDVMAYDKARVKVKKHSGNKQYVENFQYNNALIQTKVSGQLRKLKERFKTWEREYFSKYSELPSTEDVMACEISK